MSSEPQRRERAPRAQQLADDLLARGDLRDPDWRAAVAAVPRHLFVPHVHEQRGGAWRQIASGSPEGLDLVYGNRAVVTALSDRGTHHAAAARSAKPGLVARMLEELTVREGHRVLEVGTGSGYGTALLAHRIGDDNVFSVDLAPDRIAAARQRLAATGHHPTLECADGVAGLAEHGPYDRIVAHGSLPAVPRAWIDQLTEGGILLLDLKVGPAAGNLVALQRRGDQLRGRFLDGWAALAKLHHDANRPAVAAGVREHPKRTRGTSTPPEPWWNNRVAWLLAQFTGVPRDVRTGALLTPRTRHRRFATMTAPDGSRAVISTGRTPRGDWAVTESGPTALWSGVERAHELWQRRGQPDWSRIGVTATRESQTVWIDSPEDADRWTLRPLPARRTGALATVGRCVRRGLVRGQLCRS